jgi:hypothetical protein
MQHRNSLKVSSQGCMMNTYMKNNNPHYKKWFELSARKNVFPWTQCMFLKHVITSWRVAGPFIWLFVSCVNCSGYFIELSASAW